jgi:hypothetical protein
MGDYNMPEKFLQRELLVSKDDMVEAAKNYLASRNCTVGIYRPTGT